MQSLAFNSLKGHRDTVLCLDRSQNCLLLSGSEVFNLPSISSFNQLPNLRFNLCRMGRHGCGTKKQPSQCAVLLPSKAKRYPCPSSSPARPRPRSPRCTTGSVGCIRVSVIGDGVCRCRQQGAPRPAQFSSSLCASHLRSHDQVFSFDLRKPNIIYKTFETEYAHNQDEVNSVGVTTVISSPFFN